MKHFVWRGKIAAALLILLGLMNHSYQERGEAVFAQSTQRPPNDIFLPFISHGGDDEISLSNGPILSLKQTSASNSTIESLARPVTFTIERTAAGQSGLSADLDVYFEVMEATESTEVSISGEDIVIADANGNVLENKIAIPAQRNAVTVTIQAQADEIIEVPEVGFFRLQPSNAYAIDADASEVEFYARDDRSILADDSKLFVAVLSAQNGANTNAAGVATIRLKNDNRRGFVNVNFSGLTSPQIAAHIHEASTDNIVYSIPLGQASDLDWPINAADPLFTNQATLDALLSGQLYINIHSRDFPDGEIKAALLPVDGSIDMPTPPSPDPIEPLSGHALTRDIVRFLTQATFGPTPETVSELEVLVATKGGDRIAAYTEWLDSQMQLKSPSLEGFHAAFRLMFRETDPDGEEKFGYIRKGLTEGWFTSAVYGKAQLRDRIGFALSEIFVISIEDQALKNGISGVANYYDMLRENAFETYKKLLTDVSTHPSMGWYLSHFQNQAEQVDELGEVITSPDENYAREIMQLFSIGLIELHPDGSLKLGLDGLPVRTYDQTDITELARVFTGWGMSVRNPDDGTTDVVVENDRFNFSRHPALGLYHPYWSTPMKMFEDNGRAPDHKRYVLYHDKGEKTVLGSKIPAGLSGEEDLETVMSLLSEHANTAPFISYRLIQRLVTSNPSAGYLYRVSSAFTDSGGDLGEVVKAILLDPEARNSDVQMSNGYGKQKEPVIHFAAMMRLVNAKSALADTYPLEKLQAYGFSANETNQYENYADLLFLETDFLVRSDIGFEQTPLRAPSVFNFFLPDYAPPGSVSGAGLVAPELQIATENQVVAFYNAFYRLLLTDGFNAGRPQGLLDPVATTYELPAWLVDGYMTVMDTNSDGQLTEADSTFDDPAAIRSASQALVESLDLYLCAGRLTANSTGNPQTDAYTILVDGLIEALQHKDGKSGGEALEARDERIREALFLVGTTPSCLTQQ